MRQSDIFSINSSNSILLNKNKCWMHFAESKSQGIVTLKREHIIVQPHCFGVIELRILELAIESGFPKGTGGTAVLNGDFILPASKRISEKYFFLVILLELFIIKKNNNNNKVKRNIIKF